MPRRVQCVDKWQENTIPIIPIISIRPIAAEPKKTGTMRREDKSIETVSKTTASSPKEVLLCMSMYKIDIDLIMHFEIDEIAFGRLPQNDLVQMFAVGKSINIFVSEMCSPSKFWFQRSDDGDLLEAMMEHLR